MRARILSGSAKQVDYHEQVQKFLPDSLRYIYSSHRQTFNPLPTPPIPSRFILAQRRSRRSYTIFGDLKSGTRPFVVLIGSPCISQTYMLPARQPIQDIRSASRPVRPARRRRDEPAGFLTPALFVAELYNLVRHLRISSDFDLLGQSWGVTFRSLCTGHRDLSTSS